MGGLLTQLWPPSPTLTEDNIPSLTGKVFIVTGGNAGVGLELVKMLYSAGGTVYIAARSPSAIATEIDAIKSAYPRASGVVKSLHLDLSDLKTVETCASAFLAQESRLDVLWNNAAISRGPVGSLSAQGHEIHLATNCLGPFLLTQLLLPVLVNTAKVSPESTVRVVFTTSGVVDMKAPPGGLTMADVVAGKQQSDVTMNYCLSKAGNWFLASEFDKRVRTNGIVCLTQNPGTLRTKGWDDTPWWMRAMMAPLFREPKMGAYTELWAGLSPEVKIDDGGRYAISWGRWHPSPRKDILESLKTKEEGGTGVAAEFREWCEKLTRPYAEPQN